MTAWLILSIGFALAMVCSTWLQHRRDVLAMRLGPVDHKNFNAGLERAAEIVEAFEVSSSDNAPRVRDNLARAIRGAKR